ncbi:TPA: ANR family transcriptional regulator [Vibrio parahaemolyticus]|uniref:ANR family transcriptional regulator n=1 Tax=Vibrio TaxID=662 RepID=UPI0019D439C9|nr:MULTISPECIES: ANR family transcriptional regulator [Vibrio]MBN8107731.1 ANR family transcriptional regulator [Vibrio vulnificus]UPR17265.1 ANR family transcriptional regulator [Vibrio parahaemolyticus]UPR23248.1 ANR family transcriptional regulator [Vibrio parahaemolyticus]HAV1517140.1 ANR family transcriptional regulator [Vibrio parahaemolyticus]HAV1521800.1 ANR family transcriptional regulator [Vibrio parahaemolyticus]
MSESNFYMDAATKAARAEKDGAFTFAKQLWESAAYSALCGQNRHWALARADYCRAQVAIQRRAQEMQEVVHV